MTTQRELQRLRSQAIADKILAQNRARQDFRQYSNVMNQSLGRDVEGIEDDYSGRGLYNSGIRKGDQARRLEDHYSDLQTGTTTLQRQLEDISRQTTRNINRGYSGLEGTLFSSTSGGIQQLLQNALNKAKGNVYGG